LDNVIQIGECCIGDDCPCFIIAEAGVNHDGSLENALKLVDAAAEAGVDAVKFQLFRVDEQVSVAAPTAEYQQDNSGAKSMAEMAISYDLPWEAHREILEHCRKRGIKYMSSCFDQRAVDFLIELGGDCIKVGSGELTNYPLLSYMAKTGLPILLSTGMSTLEDVAGAVAHIQNSGDSPLALFHCVSNYPANPKSINLRAIQTLAQAFQVPVGYSDHTEGVAVAAASVAMGACIIEKHFTLDRSLPGPDHKMSLDPDQLKELVCAVRDAEAALGDGLKRPQPEELPILEVARRSLVASRFIARGEKLSDNNLTLKRPGTGIDPRAFDFVCGRSASVDISSDTLITWGMLK